MAFELKKVRVPTARDRVNKEDCAFCFKNVVRGPHPAVHSFFTLTGAAQETEGGLFVDLNSFIGVCGDHLALHHERTSNTVYLHIVRTRTLKPVRPSSLARPALHSPESGGEGGRRPEAQGGGARHWCADEGVQAGGSGGAWRGVC